MRSAWPILLLLVACGPTRAPVESASRVDAILGGTDDTTTATVFLLDLRFDNGEASICSAVQVTPRVLLTAAHCIEPALHGTATSVTVKATNKANDAMLMSSDFIDVTVQERHPQWNASASQSPYDIAALLLSRAPSGTTPVPLQRTLPANFVGRPIRLVGYGRSSASAASSSGTRRTVTLNVGGLTADFINFGVSGVSGICSGDSGGPALFLGPDSIERVAGIHSSSSGAACGTGSDVRVDARLPFIDGFIAANDPPLCTGDGRCASGCPTADPDCPTGCEANGTCVMGCPTPDPDCACRANGTCETGCPTGVMDPDCVCTANGACETGCPTGVVDPDCRCRADGTCEGNCPGGGTDPDCSCSADAVCVAACPSSQPDPDCADCGANGTCSAASCPSADPDCLDDGVGCTSAAECVGHQCLDDPRGFKFCSRSCTASADCQLDMVCSAGLCRAPMPDTMQPVRGGCASAPGAPWLALALLLGARVARRRANLLRASPPC